MEHFSPISSTDLRSDAIQSQIIGRDAGEDHTQIIGGDTANLLGGYIPQPPPGFGTPGCSCDHINNLGRFDALSLGLVMFGKRFSFVKVEKELRLSYGFLAEENQNWWKKF